MSKRYICKSKFHVCYHFLKIFMKILGEKNLLTLPVPNILKQLIEIKIFVIFPPNSGLGQGLTVLDFKG